VNFDLVTITTFYPGGSPEELESLVTIPIERKLREVDGLDKIRAFNMENVSSILVYIDDQVADKPRVVQDVKDAVDAVTTLPDRAEPPDVVEVKIDKSPLVDIGIAAADEGVPYKILKESADRLEDFLYEIDGVADVQTFGELDREFQVNVDPASLRRYRMDLETVVGALRDHNINLPGGILKLEGHQVVLRTLGLYRNVEQIENTALRSNDAGYVTRIKDVAQVEDSFVEATQMERVNGSRAIRFKVFKKNSSDEIELMDRLRARMADFKPPYPQKVKLSLFEDMSEFTRQRISSVVDSAAIGFVLLAVVLFLMLGWRLSTIVAVSIPIAFMVAFTAMLAADIMLNIISLFAMVMVLGMIVDFSIVVAENSYRYMENGLSRRDAIVRGVAEVFWPVTVTLACICAAFAPLLFLGGVLGKFIVALPMVLMICLGSSWFAAMFVLPAHLDLFARARAMSQQGEAPGRFGAVQRFYKRSMGWALRHRYLALASLLLLLVGSLAMVAVVGFVFISGGGEKNMTAEVKLPQGATLERTLQQARVMEDILLSIPAEEVDAVRATVGAGLSDPFSAGAMEASHEASFMLYLVDEKDRRRVAADILNEVRQKVEQAKKEGRFAKDVEIEVDLQENGPPVGDPVSVELRGSDFDTLQKIGAEYIDYLNGIEGVLNPKVDLEPGKQEYRYSVDEVKAKRAGLNVRDVATALNIIGIIRSRFLKMRISGTRNSPFERDRYSSATSRTSRSL
jgi:multidrug efflux pump subunit AcrB